MNEMLLDLLYRSFDEELSKEEQIMLDKALASSLELNKEKDRIAEMRKAIAENAERSFKPFFSARVMQRIKADETEQDDFFTSLVWTFRRFAIIGAITIILLLANSILVDKSISIDTALAMPQLTLEDTWQLDIMLEEEE